ncbi:hypothetical protein DL96DRAFT_1582791 [Flagelloscypha sp. PMI_526]|nr:hypothetical protein DL96DRAFT_1582791 [Flagelloscypha sp. PMI_526]
MSKSKSAKSSKPKDKHEETLKRYKTLITACGVRRPYAKIFKEKGITDSLPKQVICLKRILQDELGMTGKMGMAQAKEIRERRELAQDIADADAFTKSILVNGKRASRSAPKTTRPSSDTEEQEIDAQPTARTSIAAFLQDQSDSESD